MPASATARSLSWLKSYVRHHGRRMIRRRQSSSRYSVTTDSSVESSSTEARSTDRERPSDDRRRPRRAGGRRPRQLSQDVRRRTARIVGVNCRLRSVRSPARPARQCLDDEQRVALRLRPDPTRDLRVDRSCPGKAGGEPRRVGTVQAVEGQNGHGILSAERLDHAVEWMVLVDLLRAQRPDDQQRRITAGANDVAEQLERVGVAPLQVVDDQQPRAFGDWGAPVTVSRSPAPSC